MDEATVILVEEGACAKQHNVLMSPQEACLVDVSQANFGRNRTIFIYFKTQDVVVDIALLVC